jgi:triacylglycerol lipase
MIFPARILVLVSAMMMAHAGDAEASKEQGEPVVLLHGIALNAFSLKHIEKGLKEAGFRPCTIEYPSRHHPIDTLAARFVLPEIFRCFPDDTVPIHFVTHSMGGLVARKIATLEQAPRFGRVVMIAPPNQGSEVADRLRSVWWYRSWYGPAGRELGTDSASAPRSLGAPSFEFGVIAATRSVDPWFSEWLPGRDDGKVAVENTKLEGMRDFIEVPASHTLVLWQDETVRQVLHFLREGTFARDGN